ncbi:cobyrinate a,c-diamide synthase [Petralouisia muris]|uniref:Cobyrinate a,c-diamide synthase n=1 Tax=Petralouisia muris TaxID=3032872 RepID=A0AC61S2T0_9FIRM|nr:cobyrinate a,c-diamide synthase [Petralouisia muris]TGY98328.1 cobyrinate a,c-diamide synthase [Petralouisia muris]
MSRKSEAAGKSGFPRIMIAAPASGSGKTLITCGLLKALANRGLHPVSFKCGPDYIDPMFHRKALGIPARNLDLFFTGEETTRTLFQRAAAQADISLLEGVMGFYDGAGGVTSYASSYELAKVTDTPVILVVNARGMSLSLLPLIQGFLEFREDSRIAGVILNQISPASYGVMKEKIEEALPVKALGYVPKAPKLALESRHLGLVTPEEVEDIQDRLQSFAQLLEETLDIEGVLKCARKAAPLPVTEDGILEKRKEANGETAGKSCPVLARENQKEQNAHPTKGEDSHRIRIGIARDEAFCFCYEENLELLEQMGAELAFFSPLHDKQLPSGISGLILYGGYPELYAQELSGNDKMRGQISSCLNSGMPYLAECGGFLYLQESMEDLEGRAWPMAGVCPGTAHYTGKLGRFGYITLTAREEGQLLQPGGVLRAHEFHYFDCTENGQSYHGKKPFGGREWDCIRGGANYAAGFPHLYYYSNPGFAERFLDKCREFRSQKPE